MDHLCKPVEMRLKNELDLLT